MSSRNLLKLNLFFILIFLNIWDFVISREFINAMLIGVFAFGPAVALWFLGNIKSVVAITVFSIFEFMVLAVITVEGFELSGLGIGTKTIFWVPFLVMAGINGFWGLKIYTKFKENRLKGAKLKGDGNKLK